MAVLYFYVLLLALIFCLLGRFILVGFCVNVNFRQCLFDSLISIVKEIRLLIGLIIWFILSSFFNWWDSCPVEVRGLV